MRKFDTVTIQLFALSMAFILLGTVTHAAPDETAASATGGIPPYVQSYLKQNCHQCPGATKQKAD